MPLPSMRYPRNLMATLQDGLKSPMEVEYDEIYYDYNSLTYKSRYQENQIKELENKIKEKDKEIELVNQKKEREREKSIQSLIAYFYNK